jgi:cysteine desulfurase/selenocysteine lyase
LPVPFKFEAGIQDYLGIIGLNAAIDFLEKLGQDKIKNYIEDLTSYAFQELNKMQELRFLADYNLKKPSSLFSFYFKNRRNSLYDFNLFLNHELKDYYVAVRCGHHCAQPLHDFLGSLISMRLSFFVYNTRSEVDIFVNALKEFIKLKK